MFERLQFFIGLGYKVEYFSFGLQWNIKVSREDLRGEIEEITQTLPMDDSHCNEEKMIRVMDFIKDKILNKDKDG